jgi:dihydropteroate synthase
VSGPLARLLARPAETSARATFPAADTATFPAPPKPWPLLLAVLNVTPDSFSDGGNYTNTDSCHAQIDRLLAEGADVLDIGGESTRPGARQVPAEEQIGRVSEAIRYAVARGALVSIDTASPAVARVALDLGATIVNDVSCLADHGLAREVAAHGQADLIVMHSRGAMTTMPGFSVQPSASYTDVVGEVRAELAAAGARALEAGVSTSSLYFDPGLGFHKSAEHSYALLRGLRDLTSLGPLVVGPSRKSFLNRDVQTPPADRLGGTVAACLVARSLGAAIVRVHDVAAVRQAFAVADALGFAPPGPRAEASHV